MKPTVTWIVIADGARARILSNTGPGKGLTPVEGAIFQGEHLPAREIMADKPGRTFESIGSARHAKEASSDPHELLKVEFLDTLASELIERDSEFDRLILVAPPHALGTLRKALNKPLENKVHAELRKDLTHIPNGELPRHLDAVIAL
jgi:protein required for attachment to host cells